MINAVVFDLDDTLFAEHEFVRSGFCAVGVWVERRFARRDFFPIAWELFHNGERTRIFDRTLDALSIPHDPELIQDMVDVYRDHFPRLTLLEDARAILDAVEGKKKLGIITDGFLNAQKNKVKALKLEERFDAIVYSDQFGREGWKPSPQPYQKIMELLRCTGPECLYVGDNPAKDFVTARALGWKTVQISRENGVYASVVARDADHEPDGKIASLLDLTHYLDLPADKKLKTQ